MLTASYATGALTHRRQSDATPLAGDSSCPGGCRVCLAPGEGFFFDEDCGEWFVCLPCGVRWWTGAETFSSWHELTPAERQHHQDVLDGLRVVEPYTPPMR